MEQAFLTPAQVADRLQLTESAVTRWLRDGYLRGYKRGREWQISPRDFQQFIERPGIDRMMRRRLDSFNGQEWRRTRRSFI